MSDDSTGRSTSKRRTFLKGTGALATVGTFAGCSGGGAGGGQQTTENPAADYPSKDITFIVPYPTGGGFDAYTRLMKPYLEDELGTTVTVKNVTGGGGVPAATQVYNAEPDGHTLFIWDTIIPISIQIGRDDVGFDMREMSHVGYVTQSPNAVTLMKPVDVDPTWDGFVSGVPDWNWATQGRGTVAHTGPIMLSELTGAFPRDQLNYVHYGGTGPALGGLKKGEANAFMVGTSTSAVKVVKGLDAQMQIVHASSDHVISGYMEENNVDVKIWAGDLDVDGMQQFNELTVFRRYVTGPPGVPDAIQQKQVDAFEAVINNEEFRKEAKKAARPVFNAQAGPEPVSEALKNSYQTLSSSPFKGILQSALGS